MDAETALLALAGQFEQVRFVVLGLIERQTFVADADGEAVIACAIATPSRRPI